MNKKILIPVVAVLTLAIVGVASFFALNSSDTPDTDTPPTPVEQDSPVEDVLPELVYDGDAKIYVTFYSHNEDSWESLVKTKPKYVEYRTDLIDRAELMAQYNIDWNWQTDLPVVEAMAKYENDPELLEDSGGMHVLQYLESLGAQLDPHAHNNNYADIAHVISEAGATPSNVIGGTIYIKCGRDYLDFLDFDSWHKNIGLMPDGFVHGDIYPDAKWKPLVLSDPGIGGHYFDDWTSGVWKPGDGDDFYNHYPENDIVYIGEGYPHDTLLITHAQTSGAEIYSTEAQYIKELAQKIRDGELPTGTTDGDRFMYTASIHMRDQKTVTKDGVTVSTLEGAEAIIKELLPYWEVYGEIEFVDFQTAAEIWETEYNSVPWQVDLSSFSFYDDVKDQAVDHCESRMP